MKFSSKLIPDWPMVFTHNTCQADELDYILWQGIAVGSLGFAHEIARAASTLDFRYCRVEALSYSNIAHAHKVSVKRTKTDEALGLRMLGHPVRWPLVQKAFPADHPLRIAVRKQRHQERYDSLCTV